MEKLTRASTTPPSPLTWSSAHHHHGGAAQQQGRTPPGQAVLACGAPLSLVARPCCVCVRLASTERATARVMQQGSAGRKIRHKPRPVRHPTASRERRNSIAAAHPRPVLLCGSVGFSPWFPCWVRRPHGAVSWHSPACRVMLMGATPSYRAEGAAEAGRAPWPPWDAAVAGRSPPEGEHNASVAVRCLEWWQRCSSSSCGPGAHLCPSPAARWRCLPQGPRPARSARRP